MSLQPYRSKEPGSEYLIINGSKVPVKYLKNYYLTGLRSALRDHAEVRHIISWVEVALWKISKEQKDWSETELRKHIWDLFFATSKFTTEFDDSLVLNLRRMLDKVYDHVWGLPRLYKKVFAQESSSDENDTLEGLVKKLKEFEERERSRGDSETADVVQHILVELTGPPSDN